MIYFILSAIHVAIAYILSFGKADAMFYLGVAIVIALWGIYVELVRMRRGN